MSDDFRIVVVSIAFFFAAAIVIGFMRETSPACPSPPSHSWLDPRPMGPAQSFERGQ